MYKACTLYTVFIIISLSLFSEGNCFGQAYTYTRTNIGCSGQWNDADCWDIVDTNCTTSNTYPPSTLTSTTCETNITINGDVTYTGDMTFGGAFSSITIADNSTFGITGNLTFDDAVVDINLEGRSSAFDIGLKLTINNSDTLNIIGPADLLDGEEITSFVTAGDLYLRGKSMLSIDAHAGVDITGTTDAHTPSNSATDMATIDVDGIFYTTSIYIRGNSHLAFVVSEDAEVRASETGGTLDMNGNSTLTFIGDVYETGGDADGESYIDVGGAIDTNGSGAKITADDATLFTCNTFPTDITKVEKNLGKFEEGNCRILPVVWLDIDTEFNQQKSQPKISWATAKEWESSHFIIERAVNDIAHFEQVGQINAIGWAQTVTAYTFYDPVIFPAGARLYYRLKQVNLDGSYDYSRVVSLQVEDHSHKAKWMAFPNPTNGNHLSLLLPAGKVDYSENITIKIFTLGQFSSIISKTIAPSHSINLNEVINKAPKGLLILEINQANRINRIKILNR